MKPQSGEIKFKVLPRAGEKPAEETAEPRAQSRTIIYVGAIAVALLAFCLLTPKSHKKLAANTRKSGVISQSSAAPNDKVAESIHEHMIESEAKEALLVKQAEIENMQFKDEAKNMKEEAVRLPDQPSLGVQLDQEDTADRVYEDLNGEPARYADFLPSDKISAKLANRQWVNQQERAERIAFVTNFIRSAYDRGYEVDIDSNLIVTGVRPMGNKPKVGITEILDKLNKQQ